MNYFWLPLDLIPYPEDDPSNKPTNLAYTWPTRKLIQAHSTSYIVNKSMFYQWLTWLDVWFIFMYNNVLKNVIARLCTKYFTSGVSQQMKEMLLSTLTLNRYLSIQISEVTKQTESDVGKNMLLGSEILFHLNIICECQCWNQALVAMHIDVAYL